MSSSAREEFDHIFKIVMAGDPAVGKSSLLAKYGRNSDITDYKSTIGTEFSSKIINTSGKKIKTQVWDTSGMHKFRAIRAPYYKGSRAVILMFDLTSYTSFKNVSFHLNEAKETIPKDAVIILVGTKSDLSNRREVTEEEARAFAESNSLASYFETSVKANTNVQEIFLFAAERILLTNQLSQDELSENKVPTPGNKRLSFVPEKSVLTREDLKVPTLRVILILRLEKCIEGLSKYLHEAKNENEKEGSLFSFWFSKKNKADNQEGDLFVAKYILGMLAGSNGSGESIAAILSAALPKGGVNNSELNEIMDIANNSLEYRSGVESTYTS